MAFGYNKLYSSHWLKIASLWSLKCCSIWLQQTGGQYNDQIVQEYGHYKTFLVPVAATVRCGQRKQHFWGPKEAIGVLWPPQFVVTEGHNIWKVTSIWNSDNHSGGSCILSRLSILTDYLILWQTMITVNNINLPRSHKAQDCQIGHLCIQIKVTRV